MRKNNKIDNCTLINHDTRLREYLMTNFLIIIVYELISKPLFSYFFTNMATCKEYKHMPSELMNWNIINQEALRIMMENIMSQIICIISGLLPKWLYSSLPWANENLAIVVLSIATTWFLIWLFFRIAKLLYKIDKVKEYMQAEPRKDLYTDDFWWKLLLTFLMFSILLLPLYPTFWTIILILVIREVLDKHERKNISNQQ